MQWAVCLPRFILKCRCDLAWHLRKSFLERWHGAPMSSTVFPLPVPFPGIFGGGGPHLSKKKLQVLAQKRLVHVFVIVLNKLYLGRYASSEELRRPPNDAQLKVIWRLYSFVAVSGFRSEGHPVPPGRSGPQLVASLAGLEEFLAKHPEFQSSYVEGKPRPWKSSETDVEKYPQLVPYRSLDAGRLKLTGTGSWPLQNFLESNLWLPYVEPKFLLHGYPDDKSVWPSFQFEKKEEYLTLAWKWDSLGLLRLVEQPLTENHFCKVFNAFKSSMVDRQIGDRRIPNSRERGTAGPSRLLPSAVQLCSLMVPRWTHSLRGAVTDRRDFYHQAMVSEMRAVTNITPYCFPIEVFEGSRALQMWREELSGRKRQDVCREKVGDGFGLVHRDREKAAGEGTMLYPAFGGLFQGDHLGVEFALEGHENLLKQEGLLLPHRRLQSKMPLPRGKTWEGLIIDDYFCISAQHVRERKENSEAYKALVMAREAYCRHELPGSIEKDVVAEENFKAAGGEVISCSSAVNLGVVPVAAPLGKRLGLSAITLRVAMSSCITSGLASRLAGSWVSVLLFRRCLSSIVVKFFALVSELERKEEPVVAPLPRDVAEDLAMLAAMAPLMFSDASAPVSREVFATDASLAKGAIVKTEVDDELAAVIWANADKKGHYTTLDNPFRAARRHLGIDCDDLIEEEEPPSIEKPFQLRFDFVELFGGAGLVSAAMHDLGFVVAPVLDLSNSKAYDLGDLQMLAWVLHMVETGAFASLFLAPPCTTFSPAAHPMVRSYACPRGWDRKHPKVFHREPHGKQIFGNLAEG